MGKKTKIGKQRKDKFYFLAKEAGFRSRAAFKLIQLNKRFEFLQKSRALVDLCAAPGGWLQVAEQNMPVSSLRIGVDLVPIKPIKNCITLQGDITEEKTRRAVRKELQTWEADCVLHDGAPNVGTNWSHDAFQQNCLVLSALRLATQVLHRGGYFVTKVFRSADSQTLISVFEKLFKKIHLWKPAASRLESAESFVVCEKYLKPDKVDPELLDPKKVFSSQPSDENDQTNLQRQLLHPRRKEKKPKAFGYEEDGELGQYRELPVSEFLASKNSLQLLARASALVFDSEKTTQSEHTTEEIRECLNDIKVCGPAEIRRILAWRKKLVAEQNLAEKNEKKEEEEKSKSDRDPLTMEIEEIEEEQSQELKELEEIDELIRNAQADEKSKLKKRKKKLLKEKRKLCEWKKLKMVHEGDEPMVGEDLEIFSLKTIQRALRKAREKALAAARAVNGEAKIVEVLDSETDDEKEKKMEADEEEEEEEELKKDDGKETIEVCSSSDEEEVHSQEGNEPEKLSESDEEMELDVDETTDNESSDERGCRKRKLTPLQLAMGEQMIYSAKRARDLEDWAWNRHAHNDEALPEWFAADEKRHNRPTEFPPGIERSRVEYYEQRVKPLNVRSIKKVVEAKMRKKQRQNRRMERAKKRAEGILENEQMEHVEKVRELKRLYKKAARPEKKDVKYQVVTKAKRGKMTRPKGPFKLVDRRLKKDNRAQKKTANKGGKKGGKRAGGGNINTKKRMGRKLTTMRRGGVKTKKN